MRVKSKIKVLIVDDSLLFRETLAKEIGKDSGIEVVGTASDPYEARDKIISLKPDVMTLDIEMPKMDGIAFLKKLMPQYPLPVIVVSSNEKKVLDALDAGAVDFITKPSNALKTGAKVFSDELTVKIKSVASANISDVIVAIGASTGGTEAIYSIIKALPRAMPGILVVQHMPAVFTKLYAERLNDSCMLEVKEAEDGDLIKPGRVLIAPGDYHIRAFKDASGFFVKCEGGEKVSGHCPSVDVLFNSVAKAAKNRSIGIILTGMGRDGAKGLLNMKNQGAYTIGQDETTSVVYGMPMVAFNIGAVIKQLPLDEIPKEICSHLSIEY